MRTVFPWSGSSRCLFDSLGGLGSAPCGCSPTLAVGAALGTSGVGCHAVPHISNWVCVWYCLLVSSSSATSLAPESVSLCIWKKSASTPPPTESSHRSARSLLVSLSSVLLATESVSLCWASSRRLMSLCGSTFLAFTCLCHSLLVHSLVQWGRLLLLQLVWQLIHLYIVLLL